MKWRCFSGLGAGVIGMLPFLAWPCLAAQEQPVVHDPRLELKLFAAEPDIVTPIGMAIDERNRIFVVESHTHHPAKDYPGPKGDRIKIFRDEDDDGASDGFTVFAEGLDAAMNLALSPRQELYVVCAREVWRLNDRDDDGVSESRDRILRLRTSNGYAHSALLGITFGPDGWLYISRGNNGSAAYMLDGTDGSMVSGYGDGGNIVRCRPDGGKVEEFATGFWNPFDIKFDHRWRLLCVDNDPDARGPNRFLHVVQHGDYGYKSMYGGGGNHPYQGWEGELPGTLPMIAGTGEAPSGLFDARFAALPDDYTNQYLITIWNENRIDRYAARRQGSSLRATNTALISGDRNFRPVALASDSRGNIFFTDWVLVDYPNHGRGRLWRLSARKDEPVRAPNKLPATSRDEMGLSSMQALLRAPRSSFSWNDVVRSLASDDSFECHAATVRLARDWPADEIVGLLSHEDPVVRQNALLALRRSNSIPRPDVMKQALSDPDWRVGQAALIWIGESMEMTFRDAIDVVLGRPDLNAVLFETWLATVQNLDRDFVQAYRAQARDKANQLRRPLPERLMALLAADETKPDRVRVLALSRLGKEDGNSHREMLSRLAREGDPVMRREAIRTLAEIGAQKSVDLLKAIALNEAAPSSVRAEALLTLSWLHDVPVETFLPLLDSTNQVVQLEAVRLLRREAWHDPVRSALQKKLNAVRDEPGEKTLVEHLEFALFPPGTEGVTRAVPRPDSIEDWQKALAEGGDPGAGARVFFSPLTACSKCHTVRHRGGRLGPDLSNLGQSVDRPQIVRSILRPSDDFPPQYQAWYVVTEDGEVHQGLQLDHKSGGAIELYTTDGVTRHFKGDDIESYGVMENSLMPEELEKTMTVAEFRDLVAFLESSR